MPHNNCQDCGEFVDYECDSPDGLCKCTKQDGGACEWGADDLCSRYDVRDGFEFAGKSMTKCWLHDDRHNYPSTTKAISAVAQRMPSAAPFHFEQWRQGLEAFTPSRLFIYCSQRLIGNTVDNDSGAHAPPGHP